MDRLGRSASTGPEETETETETETEKMKMTPIWAAVIAAGLLIGCGGDDGAAELLEQAQALHDKDGFAKGDFVLEASLAVIRIDDLATSVRINDQAATLILLTDSPAMGRRIGNVIQDTQSEIGKTDAALCDLVIASKGNAWAAEVVSLVLDFHENTRAWILVGQELSKKMAEGTGDEIRAHRQAHELTARDLEASRARWQAFLDEFHGTAAR
jgi:hypothetical protein